jgi:hypothetical protein
LFSAVDAETRRRLSALDHEKKQMLQALGIEPDFKSLAQIVHLQERALDFLPPAKRAAIMNLTTEMTGIISELVNGGHPDLAKDARREMEQKLRELLTPEESLEFELRFSTTASVLRHELAGFDASEEEFLAMYQLRKPFDDSFTHYRDYLSREEMLQMEQAKRQMEEDLKQLLGAERWKDYERTRDPEFQQMFRAAQRANLGSAEAALVHRAKKSAEQEVRRIRLDHDLSFEQRQERFEILRQEMETVVRQVLGETGWHEYERSGSAGWLKYFGYHSFPE